MKWPQIYDEVASTWLEAVTEGLEAVRRRQHQSDNATGVKEPPVVNEDDEVEHPASLDETEDHGEGETRREEENEERKQGPHSIENI